MNNLPTTNRVAIINWKEFHAARLHKKRRVYDVCTYPNRTKVGLLNVQHYIFLNLLRNLPLDRGLSEEAFLIAKAKLKYSIDCADARRECSGFRTLALPFGIPAWEVCDMLREAFAS